MVFRARNGITGGQMSQLGKRNRFDQDRQTNLVGRVYQAAAGTPDWVELVDIWSAFYFPATAESQTDQASRSGDKADWSGDELSLHLKQAVGLLKADDAAVAENALGALNSFPFAVALTNRQDEIVELNTSAQDRLGETVIGQSIKTFISRVMDAGDIAPSAMTAGLSDHAQTMRFANFSFGAVEAPAVLIDADDLAARNDDELSPLHSILQHLFTSHPTITKAAIILAVQLDQTSALQLRRIYNLTNSELQLVGDLVDGKSIPMVADERHKSPTTLRNQLQSIYSKTGTNRQPQLVALVCSQIFVSNLSRTFLIDDTVGATRPSGPQLWRDYADGAISSSMIELPGNRVLQVLQHGDLLGAPCLIFHPTALPPFLSDRGIETAKMLGLRCVSPIRPGFGTSTAVKFSATILDDFAHDLAHTLDQLGIAKAPILTSGLGTVWAFRFAELYPARVTHMEIGTVPVSPGRMEAKKNWQLLAPHRRVALFNPVVLPLVTRIQLHHFSRASREERKRILQRIYFAPQADLEVLNDDHVLDWALSWTTPEGERSQKGIISDLRVQDETHWVDHASNVKASMHLWHGSENPLNRLDLAQQFTRQMKRAELTVIQGAGELFFYQIEGRVLTALKRHCA